MEDTKLGGKALQEGSGQAGSMGWKQLDEVHQGKFLCPWSKQLHGTPQTGPEGLESWERP